MTFTILQNDLGIHLTGLAKKNVASPVPFEFLILQDLLNMHSISGLTTGGLSEIQIMAILKFYLARLPGKVVQWDICGLPQTIWLKPSGGWAWDHFLKHTLL